MSRAWNRAGDAAVWIAIGILSAIGVLAFLALAIFVFSAAATGAFAHDAPSGWSYDRACCSGFDCRQVPSSFVEETSAGYRLTTTNEVLSYGDSRVKNSPDGLIHWCTIRGRDDGRTICLYMPPRSF